MSHRWHFFRAGGVDQVSLRDGADLLALPDLDPTLWVALAMPTKDVDVDAATLAFLDADKDGRIRLQDVHAAVEVARATFKQPGDLLRGAPTLALAAIADAKVAETARRVLRDLGKPDAAEISVADAQASAAAFAATGLNGDGVVTPASTDDAALRRCVEDIVASGWSAPDRSGQPGVDKAAADGFFAEVDARLAHAAARPAPLAADADAALDALEAVRAKLADHFTRCRLAAFDVRAAAALGGAEAELAALAGRTLSVDDAAIAGLPLARIDAAGRLPLDAVNPAWAARIRAFVAAAITPLVGAREALTEGDVAAVAAALAPHAAWRAARPATKVDGLDAERLAALARPELRAGLAALIAADAAQAEQHGQLDAVTRAVLYRRDLGRVLRNFASFADFYGRRGGVFQDGTLYVDGHALRLVIPVSDAGKHGGLAAASQCFLVYCDVTRAGQTRQIAAALTNGDGGNLCVGRNGVYYDREGKEWDATITKLVTAPISVRAAFWAPYQKLVALVQDTFAKRAEAAEAASTAKVDAAAGAVAAKTAAPPAAAEPAPAAPAPPGPPSKIDLGTVAAIGVAIGGIGTLVGALLGTMFGLGRWLPLGVVALALMISGPSMLLAWLKLRKRNLGPLLDANGWAINVQARINVPFGAALTDVAELPAGAQRSLDDPFADRRRPWKLYGFLVVLLVLGLCWFVGTLDRYLPAAARSTAVLGVNAPAYQAPPPAPPATPAK